jgi:hypothetical protein
MNYLQDLTASKTIFFNYMKEKYEVIYKSNIFLRDLLYAIKSFYEKKGITISYISAEKLALEFADQLVKSEELQPIKKNTWKVNFSLDIAVI